jgi:predicted lipid carrier protein YhbT
MNSWVISLQDEKVFLSQESVILSFDLFSFVAWLAGNCDPDAMLSREKLSLDPVKAEKLSLSNF